MNDDSPTGPLTDEEFGALGKTLGTLIHYVMRARQDNPEAGMMSVLSILAKCGPIRASEVAQLLYLDLSTVSRHVQNLERTGYVEKVADPKDRRAMTLHLTAEGKDHVEQLWEGRVAKMREGLSHWDPAELRKLTELLSRYGEDFAAIITKGIDENKHDQHKDQHKQEHKHENKHGKTTEDGS
jgi:DNA-binding MarR family transcriptional regulator